MLLTLFFSILQEPDFIIDFGAPTKQIPPGIGRGINDLSNASEGVWDAWGQAIQPDGGLARIWLDYSKGPMAKQYGAGLRAKEAGMGVFLVVVGDPSHKGVGHELVGRPPKSSKVWAEGVAQDAKSLLQRGVPLTHIEIWNEPNFAGQWQGTPASFGEFFAGAGKHLRQLLPSSVKLGGPGMASASGAAYDWFEAIAAQSKHLGFQPDFLSWHFYSSYPGDIESCRFNERIAAVASKHGLNSPDLILSEWNIDLPHPTAPECDDHRAAAFYVGVNSFLAETIASDSLFFFLQDGFWEAKTDYAGESVGVFTLHGGPKSVLNGMRLFRKASALPKCEVERNAPWNFSCLATSDGEKAYLLLSNSFGQGEKRARHFVDANGVNLGNYQGKEGKLRAFIAGKLAWEDLGANDKDRKHWETARQLLKETKHEISLKHRQLRIGVTGATPKPVRAWRIDDFHSDPRRSPEYMKQFIEIALEAPQRASEKCLENLQQDNLSSIQLNRLAEVFSKPQAGEMLADLNLARPILGVELHARVAAMMRDELKRAQDATPTILSEHPKAQVAEVAIAKTIRREGGQLLLDLPPWSVIMIEFDLPTK